MKKLSDKAYKVIKIIHILSASIWTGAGLVVLFLLSFVLEKSNVRGILPAIHYVDLLIIIPANLLTLLSGLVFSKFTGWGFFRHRWIILKYVINLAPVVLGGIIFAPSIQNMLSIVETIGEDAVSDPAFISQKIRLMGSFILILVLLITAVCLTVFKPKRLR